MDEPLKTLRRASGFSGANAEYIDQLYEAFRNNPDSVAPEWRSFFFGFEHGAGDALDFWRVDAIEPDLFRLRAEMLVPGEAWLEWWAQRARGGFSTGETDWHYGMVLLGDPLLVTQAHLPIPEPATLGLLGAGALLAATRRRAPRR